MQAILLRGVAVGSVLLLGGCGAFGPCFSESVQVDLTGSVVANQSSTPIDAFDQVAPGNTAQYPALRRFLIDGDRLEGQQVVWTVGGLGTDGYLAVFVPGTVTTGQVLTITGFVQGGGWGVLAGSSNGVTVSLRLDGFVATEGSGSLTVHETRPFKATIDLVARVAGGGERHLTAVADFRFQRDEAACD